MLGYESVLEDDVDEESWLGVGGRYAGGRVIPLSAEDTPSGSRGMGSECVLLGEDIRAYA